MNSTVLKAVWSAIIVVSVSTGFAQVAEPVKVKLDTSLVFTRGDYGLPEDTEVFVALVNPTVELEGWRFQASIPYVRLNGPASIVGNTGSAGASRSTNGLGDLTLSVTRKIQAEPNDWATEVGAKVKFPTADDAKGLGTGEMDGTIQVDVFKRGGPMTPFGTLGYQFLGSNANYPMKNGAFATLGFAGEVAPNVTVGLAGNWRQAIVEGGESAVEAMAFVQRKLSDQSRLQVFVLHGFTDASPTLAIGATLGFSF